LQEIIKEICLKLSQLYNADVTGLFWWTLAEVRRRHCVEK
jgi:hypothetical protein